MYIACVSAVTRNIRNNAVMYNINILYYDSSTFKLHRRFFKLMNTCVTFEHKKPQIQACRFHHEHVFAVETTKESIISFFKMAENTIGNISNKSENVTAKGKGKKEIVQLKK